MGRQFLVVDDHPLLQRAISDTLSEVAPDCQVRVAGRLSEALRLLGESSPVDLVLFDLSLPDSAGIEGLATLRERHPDCPVVVISGDTDAPTIHRCLDLGAAGYIPKTESSEGVHHAITQVASGCTYVPTQALATLSPIRPRQAPPQPPRHTDPRSLGLTDRQCDVLKLLLRGLPNKLICRQLDLAEGTVKVHVSAVLRSLGVRNRTQAVIAAAQKGLRFPD